MLTRDDDYDHYEEDDDDVGRDDSWGDNNDMDDELRHRARWRACDVVSMYGLAHLAPLIMQSGSYNVQL